MSSDIQTTPEPSKLPSDPKWHNECLKNVEKAIKDNKYLVKLLETMEQKGCVIPKDFFKCEPCQSATAAHYSPKEGITICENNLYNASYVSGTLVHETIHAFDHCRAHLKWDNPEHIACSEIRAANLSGDCHWKREFLRLNGHKFHQQHQKCVRRRAEISVSGHFPPEVAKVAVDKVWDTCFNDTEPFDQIP